MFALYLLFIIFQIFEVFYKTPCLLKKNFVFIKYEDNY